LSSIRTICTQAVSDDGYIANHHKVINANRIRIICPWYFVWIKHMIRVFIWWENTSLDVSFT